MLRIVLIQPGSTDFDEQGRIKGSLDIPLSVNGADQVERTVQELARLDINVIYTSPTRSAVQTAQAVARGRKARIKRLEKLRNLDHGLWHGKRIEEVRQTQPRVYRQCQDYPEMVCPPEGESITAAQLRVQSALGKIAKRHKNATVAIVVSEPLASVVRSCLQRTELKDFWKAEHDHGRWTLIEVTPDRVAVNS